MDVLEYRRNRSIADASRGRPTGPDFGHDDAGDDRIVAVEVESVEPFDRGRLAAEVIDHECRVKHRPSRRSSHGSRSLSSQRRGPTRRPTPTLETTGDPSRHRRSPWRRVPAITSDLALEHLGHVAASPARPRDLVDRFDQLLGQHQVRAHVHAHNIAHDRAHTGASRNAGARPRAARPTIGLDATRVGPHRGGPRRPRRRRGLLGLDPAGRPGPRPGAVRVRPRQRRVGRPQPHHPALVPPARLRPPGEAGVRDLGRRRGRGGRAGRDGHRWPGPVAGRPGDPEGRLHREPGGRGRPVRAARRARGHAPLAAVAPRRGHDRDVPGAGWAGRSVQGQRRAPPARGGTRGDAPRPDAGDGHPRRSAARSRSTRAARPIGRDTSSWPPMPGPTSCWRRSGGSCR